MNEEITDRIKSFVLGIVFPLVLTCLAVTHMTGHRTRSGTLLTPLQAFGYGLWTFGIGMCIHAFFYQRYDNHPGVKRAVIAVGVISLVCGPDLQFR